MNYTEEIWADLDWDEKQTYRLYEEFQKATIAKGIHTKWVSSADSKSFYDYDRDGKYPGDKIRESKNWQYFVDVWEKFKDDQMFDPYVFIEAVFRRLPKDKTIVPAQLRTKANYDYYKEYRLKLKMGEKVSDEKQILMDITNTYKLIQRKMNKTELDENDLFSFFNELKDNSMISEGIFLCIQEMISPYYYSVSRSFLNAFLNCDKDIRDEISSEDRLINISAVVRSKTRVYQFLKKIFGKDIV